MHFQEESVPFNCYKYRVWNENQLDKNECSNVKFVKNSLTALIVDPNSMHKYSNLLQL